jgi:hypothetical protein
MLGIRKLLICEDDENVAKLTAYISEDYGFRPIINAKQKRPDEVLQNIESLIIEHNPECMITDGLNRSCFDAIDIAKKVNRDIKCAIWTGDKDLYTEAETRGYYVFEKPGNIEKIFEFLYD